ncbi:unnamed protein product [Cuscuta campestris]|uniref:Uncharacterized protein n=1 Tax=Cuscuta campestris TaxID=132261 RepID=A0A484KXP5_9ASTE|nr:unnamed protein product [Cuscuta campestris]
MISIRVSTISNTWRARHRRPLILDSLICRRPCRCKPYSFIPSASPSKAPAQVDAEFTADFLQWLELKAGTEISSALSIGESTFGRSLFARTHIKAGDCILKVPYSVQVSSNNLPLRINSLLGDQVSNVAKVALLVLYEQKLGEKSEWAPYIRRLPQPAEMHNTIFWKDGELEMIRPSPLYRETIRQKKIVESDFLAITEALCHFPKLHMVITLDDFKYAYALVTSRAWESFSGVSMIPFADFLNHDGLSDSLVLNDDGKQFSEV